MVSISADLHCRLLAHRLPSQVIIKGTKAFRGARFEECTDMEILQVSQILLRVFL